MTKTESKQFSAKDFSLESTPLNPSDKILFGSNFNDWVNFGTMEQRWRNPYRVVEAKNGKLYMEDWAFKTLVFDKVFELKSRIEIDKEEMQDLKDDIKLNLKYDENAQDFIN